MNMWTEFGHELKPQILSLYLGTGQVASGPKSSLTWLGFGLNFFSHVFYPTFLGFSPVSHQSQPLPPHPFLIYKADVASQALTVECTDTLVAPCHQGTPQTPLSVRSADWLKMASSNLAFVL